MTEKKLPAEIDDLLQEDRTFPPPDAFRAQAIVRDESVYELAARDPEAFWAAFAGELDWFTPWTKILDWQPTNDKWFLGGTLTARLGKKEPKRGKTPGCRSS